MATCDAWAGTRVGLCHVVSLLAHDVWPLIFIPFWAHTCTSNNNSKLNWVVTTLLFEHKLGVSKTCLAFDVNTSLDALAAGEALV